MTVTFWLDGEALLSGEIDWLPPINARLGTLIGVPYVVTEHWYDRAPGDTYNHWHIVLRRPETPAERTPPWERGKETP